MMLREGRSDPGGHRATFVPISLQMTQACFFFHSKVQTMGQGVVGWCRHWPYPPHPSSTAVPLRDQSPGWG